MEKTHLKYDAFISYKRHGGLGWAELVWVTLSNKQKNIFIDHSVSSGTQHRLWDELRKEIDRSMNVIVVIFEGIQDVLKPQNDVFLQELRYAYKTKKNIIPFYVDGLSSSIIKSEKRFQTIPSILKKIASGKHSDICYIHGKSLDWADNLIKSFQSKEEVLQKTHYLVEIQTNKISTFLVWGKDGEEIVEAGKKMPYWVDYTRDFVCELSIPVDNEEKPIRYKVVVDPQSSEPYKSGYKERKCIPKNKGKKIVVFEINWERIKHDQNQARPIIPIDL